jgi:broad specificity phosphatase PhoE
VIHPEERPVTTFLLVRHAAHDLIDRVLAGRKIDVALNAHGHRQAEALARQLASEPIARIFSSPRKRARQTAKPLCAALDLPLVIAPEIDEHDAGVWAGQDFAALARDPRWRLWNERRGTVRPPAGESMVELQLRILRYIDLLAAHCPDETIVLVSHAEPIRAALMHERKISPADFLQVVVPVVSVSTLARDNEMPVSLRAAEFGHA